MDARPPLMEIAALTLAGAGVGVMLTSMGNAMLLLCGGILLLAGSMGALLSQWRRHRHDAQAWRQRTGHDATAGTQLHPAERAALLQLSLAQHDALTAWGILPRSHSIRTWEQQGPRLERWFSQCCITGEHIGEVWSAGGPACREAQRIIWQVSAGKTWRTVGMGPRFRPTRECAHHLLRVLVIARDVRPEDAELWASAPRALGTPLSPGRPDNTPAVDIEGAAHVGTTLTCVPLPGDARETAPLAIIWETSATGTQWQIARNSQADGTYALTDAERGQYLRVRLAHYRGTSAAIVATSASIGPIAAPGRPAPVVPGRVRPAGTTALRDRLAGH